VARETRAGTRYRRLEEKDCDHAPSDHSFEWMLLPREKRQAGEQAAAFALKSIEKHDFRCSGDRQRRIMAWLMPRVGRS
jgi:hypothetical protein